MSDISTRLRLSIALGAYDASYPPEILNGGASAADPHINTLTPNTVSAAAGPTTITVAGTNFEAGSVVEINQAAQATTFVSPTSLTVSYDPTVAGTVQFTVRNPNNEESNSVPFVVGAITAMATAADVGSLTVEDAKAFVNTHPELLDEVTAAERSGKHRSGLLTWLDDQRPEPEPTFETQAFGDTD